MPPDDARIPVVSPVGTVGTIPSSSLKEALQQNYRLASEEEQAKAKLEAEYGGPGQTVLAGLAGAARGLVPFGATDVALSAVSEEARKALEAYQTVSPIASGVGEAGGMLLGLGKASALAKGGGGLATKLLGGPTLGITRAGEAAGALGAAAPGALGRVLGPTARFATEGAIYGAGPAISEAALGDERLTAERLAVSMSHGALAAGGLGLGLAGLGAAVRATRRAGGGALERAMSSPNKASIEAIAERAFGEASPGLWKKLSDTWAKGASIASGADRKALEELGELGTTAGREARQTAIYDSENVLDSASRTITTNVGTILDSLESISANVKGRLKAENIERIVKRGNEADALLATKTLVSDTRGLLDEMIADKAEYGRTNMLKKLSVAVGRAERRMESGSGNAIAFVETDEIKRLIGKHAKGAQQSYYGSGDPTALRTHEKLVEHYEIYRKYLEDENLWGDAAKLHSTINAPWSKQLLTNQSFTKYFTDSKSGEWGKKTAIASPEKIHSYVRNLTSPKTDLAHDSINNWLRTTEDFVSAVPKYVDLAPKELGALNAMKESAAALRKEVDGAGKTIGLVNQLKAIESSGGGSALLGGLMGGAIGAGLLGDGGGGGVTLGAGAVLAGALMRPGQAIRRLAALEHLAGDVGARTAKTLDKVVRTSAVALPRLATLAIDRSPSESEYSKRKRNIERTASLGPVAMRSELDRSTATVADVAPHTRETATSIGVANQEYLQKELPIMHVAAYGGHAATPKSLAKDFNALAKVVSDPNALLLDLDKGHISMKSVKAIKKLYPAMYEDITAGLRERIAVLASNGKTLAYKQRVIASMLLDTELDPTMGRELAVRLQQGYRASDKEQESQIRRERRVDSKMSNNTLSGSQRLEAQKD